MSTDTIPSRTNGQTIDQTWFNLIRQVLYQDVVARNTSGVATDVAGSLGNSSIAWLRAYIKSGYFECGDMKFHHTYNGAAPIGEGWMLCDGRQVTQAAYDTEHGSGHWNTYVSSSPLVNKYLPNMTGKYPVGAATTTQDGSAPLTFVGNASNQVNISHAHTNSGHVHKWLKNNGASTEQSFDSGGTLANIADNGAATLAISVGAGTSLAKSGGGDLYTDSQAPAMNSQLSATQSIQPESLQGLWYMRII